MSVASLFIWLYPIVPIIGFMAYVPQLIHLIRDKNRAQSFTLATWCFWLLASAVSTGYGIFALHDMLFTLTCAMHTGLQSLVIMLVLFRRYENRFTMLTAQPEPITIKIRI